MSTSANLSGQVIRSHEEIKPPAHLLHQPGPNQQPQRPHRPPTREPGPSSQYPNGSRQQIHYAAMNGQRQQYNQYQQQQQQQPGQSPYGAPVEGWMANHGVPWWMVPPPNVSRVTPWSEEKIDELQDRLRLKLGPEFITQRPGPGGGPKLSYIEGWKLIALANDVFGFNGWSTSIISLTTDFMDVKEDGRVSVSVGAIVRITLKDGCFHEDIGGGQAENVKGKAAALDKAKKEAVTDGIKRALKTFGNVLGLCLYDKEYNKQVAQMKVGPMPKLDVADLERHPHFRQPKPPAPRPPVPAFKQEVAPQVGPSVAPSVNGRADMPDATPLRSLDESIMLPAGDEFDPDAYGEDSFFDGLDESMVSAGNISTYSATPSEMAAQPAAPPRQMPSAARPDGAAYQHRHRPQGVPAVNGAVQQNPQSTSSANSSAQNGNLNGSSGDKRPVEDDGPVKNGSAPGPSDPANRQFNRVASNGSAAGLSKEEGRAARARALAISGALSTSTATPTRPNGSGTGASAPLHARAAQTTPHVRPESPRIPDGGIDRVAVRASVNYHSAASKLELETHLPSGPGFGGFASARGIKRHHEEEHRGPVSPTKRMLKADGQPVRPVPRRPLGEISIGDA